MCIQDRQVEMARPTYAKAVRSERLMFMQLSLFFMAVNTVNT